MASSQFARSVSVRKPLPVVAPAAPLGGPVQTPARNRCIELSPTPHLTPDQYVHLLGYIDGEGGIATLDAISRALPRVPQPISAVFDLCDSGILNVDWESALDGDMHVWRIGH